MFLIDGDADSARYQVNELPRVGLVWLGGGVAAAGLALATTTSTTDRRRSRPATDPGDEGVKSDALDPQNRG